MAEYLTSIIVLSGFKLKKSTLVGCKMKQKLDVFNRVAQERETTSKNYWKFESRMILQPFYMRIKKYPFLILNFWSMVQLFM